jgi:hypothetical protein
MAACRNGHPRTPENIYVRPDGHRECRECRRESWRRYWHTHYHGAYAERHRQRFMERYERMMSTPEGRWQIRSTQIRGRLNRKRRALEQRPAPERLTLGQILEIAFREEAGITYGESRGK